MTRATLVTLTLLVTSAVALRVTATVSPCERAKTELRTLNVALELYRANHDGRLPNSTNWLTKLKEDQLLRDEIPGTDPWGAAYVFRPSSDDFELSSVGADGVPGTADDQTRKNEWSWSTCREAKSAGGCSY